MSIMRLTKFQNLKDCLQHCVLLSSSIIYARPRKKRGYARPRKKRGYAPTQEARVCAPEQEACPRMMCGYARPRKKRGFARLHKKHGFARPRMMRGYWSNYYRQGEDVNINGNNEPQTLYP